MMPNRGVVYNISVILFTKMRWYLFLKMWENWKIVLTLLSFLHSEERRNKKNDSKVHAPRVTQKTYACYNHRSQKLIFDLNIKIHAIHHQY